MKRILLCLLVSIIFISSGPSKTDTCLAKRKFTIQNANWILGDWLGKGQLFGKEASFSMNWKKSLNNQFLELSFQNEYMTDQGEVRIMKANAFYKFENDSITGHWFDTRGMMLLLRGNIQNDAITIYWGDKHTEQGKTIYHKFENRIKTKDFYLNEGVYHQFGNATYDRRI